MTIGNAIHKLRVDAKMSQEQFATLFHVSQQSVQKWENGDSVPELEKIIKIARYFGISLDALVMGNDARMTEEMKNTQKIKPQYTNMNTWDFYCSDLMVEYEQSMDEGLDVEKYEDIFQAVSRLSIDEIRVKFADVLFEAVTNAGQRENYPYLEPSDLDSIKVLRKTYDFLASKPSDLGDKIAGAWYGRICGCMLGKPVEGIRSEELIPFLKETGNYPMHRYILRSDVTDERIQNSRFGFSSQAYIDICDHMPVDDDTNYVVLAQMIIERFGRDFTPFDVSRAWLEYQKKDAYCTAERVAYCNFVKGFVPPQSAVYQNPYREWIGAQIRGDYFGYINPGNPQRAAEMAWRDACISHVKNGIYGEMFAAAMIACAAVTDNMEDIIRGGLAQIPYTSRLYEDVISVLNDYKNGVSAKDCIARIHSKYDEHTSHGWCHTNPNAMIVAASLLYGEGAFGKSVCMAVESCFDTDCNGATVGSVVGMAYGIANIPECWTSPLNDTLETSIFGVGTVRISDCIKATLAHLA